MTTPQDKRDYDARFDAKNMEIRAQNVLNAASNAALKNNGMHGPLLPIRCMLHVLP